MTPEKLPYGGEIWKQLSFPFNCYYIISGLDGGLMARTTDPRTTGNILISDPDGSGRTTYTQEELGKLLVSLQYSCEGQLHDLIHETLCEIKGTTHA